MNSRKKAVPIAGIHRTSVINYPGRIAACIFTQGCNLHCPYCHNPELVPAGPGQVRHRDVFSYLKTAKRLIEGVVVSGGEPTIHEGLPLLAARIKKEGFAVKIDTNGTNPEMLEYLLERGLVDFLAMDVKTSPGKYGLLGVDMDTVLQSIALVAGSGVEYEFRTTLDGCLCQDQDLPEIMKMIPDPRKHTVQKASMPHV